MNFFTLVGLLPQLISLALQFMRILNVRAGENAAIYVGKIQEALTVLEKAETPADHADAAQRVALAIAGKL